MKAIDRVFKILEDRNLKPSNVEQSIGLANGYFKSAKKRNSDIGETILLKLSKFLDVSLTFLITGEETSYLLNEPNEPYNAKEIIELQREIIKLQKENSKLKDYKSNRHPVTRPASGKLEPNK